MARGLMTDLPEPSLICRKLRHTGPHWYTHRYMLTRAHTQAHTRATGSEGAATLAGPQPTGPVQTAYPPLLALLLQTQEDAAFGPQVEVIRKKSSKKEAEGPCGGGGVRVPG